MPRERAVNAQQSRRPQRGSLLTLEEYFTGHEDSRPLFDALCRILESVGSFGIRVGKSQIAFRREKAFAWAWVPGKYLRGKVAPLVLTLALRSRNPSPRWKEVVEPYPGRFTHHFELFEIGDFDSEVAGWLREAWLAAS
jgi:Domain of unknown function (DUF5655)